MSLTIIKSETTPVVAPYRKILNTVSARGVPSQKKPNLHFKGFGGGVPQTPKQPP